MKTIGIIGAGNIGQAVAGQLVKNNIPVLIGNSRGPETLGPIITKLGNNAKGATIQDVVKADIVILALPWWKVETLTGVTDWTGKIVIDITNEFLPDGSIEDLGDRSSTEIVAGYIPGARIVKALNTLYAQRISADPVVGSGRRIAFIAGDDESAKKEAVTLIESLGFATVDIGSLSLGGKLLGAKGVFSGLNLVKL